jgi:hypothetical protein
MPALPLLLLLVLTACSATPQALGITGPGTAAPPTPTTNLNSPTANLESPDAIPGVPAPSATYGPNNTPVTGGSGFWGYN